MQPNRIWAYGAAIILAVACAGAAQAAAVRVRNNGLSPVASVQVRPAGHSEEWQQNGLDTALGGRMIRISGTADIQLPASSSCRYDFLVTFSDGTRRTLKNVDACSVRVVNLTEQ